MVRTKASARKRQREEQQLGRAREEREERVSQRPRTESRADADAKLTRSWTPPDLPAEGASVGNGVAATPERRQPAPAAPGAPVRRCLQLLLVIAADDEFEEEASQEEYEGEEYEYEDFDEFDEFEDEFEEDEFEEEASQEEYEGEEYEYEDFDDDDLIGYCVWDPYTPAVQSQRPRGAVPAPQPGDELLAPGVWARTATDRHHCLLGAPLANAHKLLTRVLLLEQPKRGELLWRSSLALTEPEWCYIKEVISSTRLRPLLEEGTRVLEPLPGRQPPTRLRPRNAATGEVMRGPYISRNGLPHNHGRQFFSTFSQAPGDTSGFIWADGVHAYEVDACASAWNDS